MNILAATQINAGGLWGAIRSFFTDFNRMFPGFEAGLEDARAPFYIFGFVILVYSLVKKLSSSGMSTSSNIRAITGIVALVGAMAFCIQITQLTQVAFLDLSQQMAPDADPVKIEQSMEELLVALTKGEAEKQQTASNGGQAPSGLMDSVKGFVAGAAAIASNPGAAINAGLDSALASITTLIQYAMIYILVALCKLAEMVMWIVILVQKLLILINSIFLPVMIAMLGVSALSGISTRYIMSMFGVCAWPLAWGVVNAGTVAMMISVNKTLEGATDLNSLMAILWAYAICVVIPFWLIFGYVFGPLVMQKMVTTGAGVAQGFLGGAGSLAGAAAVALTGGGAAALAGANVASGSGSKMSSGNSSGGDAGGSSTGGGSSQSSSGGSGRSGAGLAGTFSTAAGASMQAVGSAVGTAGNSLAQSEGHSGVYSSNAGTSSGSAGSNEGLGSQGNSRTAEAGSATAAQIPQKMSNAQLDAYAAKRGMEMAQLKQATKPSDHYPGLTESSSAAWHQEQMREGLA